MKRKLRIFSNIAIICLSVCMFAFGVYAASTVSVTTSGTVTFNATGVYARVTRTVTGTTETVADFDKTIDTSSTSPIKITELKENLTFADPNFPIIMTFTIENKAVDRNLDFTFTGFSNGVEDGLDGNVAAYFMSSTDKYSEEKYNVHPMTDGLNNIETITVSFYVIDPNKSASLEYDYALNLTNQDTVLKDNLPITVNDTSTSKNSTARVVKKVGNTVILGATLNSDSQLLDFEATGASTVKHYSPTLVGNEVQKPLLVVDANATGYVSKVEGLKNYFNYSKVAENLIGPLGENYNQPSGEIVVPMAVRSASTINIISSLVQIDMNYGFNDISSLTIPSSLKIIGKDVMTYPGYLTTIVEYGSIECWNGSFNWTAYPSIQTNIDGSTYVKTTTRNECILFASDTCFSENLIVKQGCKYVSPYGLYAEWSAFKFIYLPGSIVNIAELRTSDEGSEKSIIIPSSVKHFASNEGFFTETAIKLETLTFSNTVESTFATKVFAPMVNLKTINFVGSQAEWNALSNIENAGIPSGVRINCLDGSFTIE